jgi:hypothetical protein
MESGWLVNSILSKSEDSAASRPDRSYQISPIAPSSWRALLQGRKSKMPQGLGRAHARACSTVTEYPHVHTRYDSRPRAASKSLNYQHRLRSRSCTDGVTAERGSGGCGRSEQAEETMSAVSVADRLVTQSDRLLLYWRFRIDGLFRQSKRPQTRRLVADRLTFSRILRLGLLAVRCPLQLLECCFGPSAIFRNISHCSSASTSELAWPSAGRE